VALVVVVVRIEGRVALVAAVLVVVPVSGGLVTGGLV
jgi:hypothetical protein